MSLLGAMKTCLVLTLRWLCIISTLNRMLSRSNNNIDASNLNGGNQSEVQKLIECGFIREEQPQIGLLTLCPSLKRTKRSESVLTFAILIWPKLKMNFHYLSRMSWLSTHVVLKGCPLWMTFQGTAKLRCTQIMKSIHHFKHSWVCFVIQLCLSA